MWTVPGLYGLLLVLRLLPEDRPLPRWAQWVPLLGHVVAWGWLLTTAKAQATMLTHSLTMSWGLFALIVVLGARLLDPTDEDPELFDTSLLLATMLSALWLASLGAQLPTPMSSWELYATWLIDLSGGLLLLLALLGWHIAVNDPQSKGRLSQWLTRLQVIATLCILGALACALPESTRLSLSQRGHLAFLLLAVGGLWLPPLVPKAGAASFNRPALLWLLAGAAFTVAWALVRLFALV